MKAEFVGFYCLVLLVGDVFAQTSILEIFVGQLRAFRKGVSAVSSAELMSDVNQNLLRSQNKFQKIVTNRFPCNTSNARSKKRPKSVHNLRPGDIDVIGAIGDSLTVGTGIFASSVHQVLYESRGASYFMGGDETWKTYLTVANIIKEFNPKLYGYSTGNSFTIDPRSRFNVAEGGAISDNMPYMVKVLVKRMKSDPRVNINRDWKLINILIGSNDICSEICYYRSYDGSLKKHKEVILYVLRYLRDNLPRTLVNLVPPLNPIHLRTIRSKPAICYITHDVMCPCLYGVVPQNKLANYAKVAYRWQQLDVEVGNAEEFQRDDFSVIVQSFTMNMTAPMKNGDVDLSYFAVDCFHPSQKGYAAIANNIWNALLTPVDQKQLDVNFKVMDEFLCPTEKNPYIFTNLNSNNV